MRNFLLGLTLTLAVAASLIIVIDRWREDRPERSGVEDLEARLERIETLLSAPPKPVADEKPDAEVTTPPGQRGLGDVLTLLEELEGMMLDSEKSLRRDLRGVYEKLLARMDEISTAGAPVGDGKAARETLHIELKKLGVTIHGDEMVEVAGEILEPSRALELIAVAPGGRAHEALVLIDCRPSALKIGLEDIGLVETESSRDTGQYPGDAKGAYIYMLWEGLKKPRRVEDMILNRATNDTMTRTPFMFTASRQYTDTRTWERHFAADVYKNVIALTWNFSVEAVLACPLEAARNENIWAPCADTCAPPRTKVRVMIRNAPHPDWDKL